MKTFGFCVLTATALGLAGLTASKATLDVVAGPALVQTYEASPEVRFEVDWTRVVPGLIGLVSALIGVFAGPKMRQIFDDIAKRYMPDRLLPDAELQGGIDVVIRRLLASDLDAESKAIAIGALLGDKAE